jgi:DNA-binding MarR family transcriptional regulator
MSSSFHYSPSKMSPGDLQRLFVSEKGRAVFERIISDLKRRYRNASNQHYLILGSRGIGKSHLIGMLYYEIKKNRSLDKNWLPLWFAEEEYTLVSIRDLMERVLEEIASELNPEYSELHEKLNAFQGELENIDNENNAFELITGFLYDFSAQLKKRLVVFFENFNMFLNTISSKEEKKLRSELMTETACLFITAAPTPRNFLREVADPRNALVNLFDVHNLDEFTLDECRQLIAVQCDKAGIKSSEFSLLAEEKKLKLIHRIAGGNPRLILMFYDIAGSFKNLPEVEQALLELLDRLTPYFQARTENLSPQQRKILVTFAKSTVNLLPAEVARKIGVTTNVATSQINRLVEMGFLKVVEKEGRRRGSYYELAERLYRYWYQFRTSRGRKLIMGLVEFISQWFSMNELLVQHEQWGEQLGCSDCDEDKENIRKRLEYIKESIKKQVPSESDRKDRIPYRISFNHMLNSESFFHRLIEKENIETNNIKFELNLDEASWNEFLGQLKFAIGRYADASSHFKRVINIEPWNIDVNFKEAYCMQKTDRLFNLEHAIRNTLNLITDDAEDFSFWSLSQISDLLKNEEYELADKLLVILVESRRDLINHNMSVVITGFLNYLKILIDYLKSGDKSILDRQPQEVRLTINEMANSIKKKLNLMLDYDIEQSKTNDLLIVTPSSKTKIKKNKKKK